MRHNQFFRRLGCVFVIFNFLGFMVFFLAAAWVANLLGFTNLPASILPWLLPLRIGVLALVLAVIILGVFGLRRVFMPLDDLLEAAGQVAKGDYSVSVPERGLPEVRSLARAFNNMAFRLSDTDQKRRILLADVTHELRTPLTVIQGNLEGMLDGVYLADETNLRALLDETSLLASLVEDLRILALAESGALQLRKEACDFLTLAREVLAVFNAEAQVAGVDLVFDAPETLTWINVDPGRMRQILSNLISNALRYSSRNDKVVLKCYVMKGRFVFEVIDNGPGISAADLPHIFERFYKLADSGGMGLGLAIVRHLVTAHGGSIEAQSVNGQGTLIRVSLVLDTRG